MRSAHAHSFRSAVVVVVDFVLLFFIALILHVVTLLLLLYQTVFVVIPITNRIVVGVFVMLHCLAVEL